MTSRNGLRYQNRFNFYAHVLNITLKHVFDSNFLDAEDKEHVKIMEHITKLMSRAKHFVKYMKVFGKINELSKDVEQEVKTRWNTRLAILLPIQK